MIPQSIRDVEKACRLITKDEGVEIFRDFLQKNEGVSKFYLVKKDLNFVPNHWNNSGQVDVVNNVVNNDHSINVDFKLRHIETKTKSKMSDVYLERKEDIPNLLIV